MKRYIRTSLIFALLLLTTSTSFSLPAFNDLCRSRGIPLPDKDADKIILPIEKPEIPEEPEIHEYSPRPEITEDTVEYVVVLLPPMYSRTMYRYVLKDGRVFYTDINYFPEITNNNEDQIINKSNLTNTVKKTVSQASAVNMTIKDWKQSELQTKIAICDICINYASEHNLLNFKIDNEITLKYYSQGLFSFIESFSASDDAIINETKLKNVISSAILMMGWANK